MLPLGAEDFGARTRSCDSGSQSLARSLGYLGFLIAKFPVVQIGAGIQIPPNAGRVLLEYGIFEEIRKKATQIDSFALRRYADGTMLAERPFGQKTIDTIGAPWL